MRVLVCGASDCEQDAPRSVQPNSLNTVRNLCMINLGKSDTRSRGLSRGGFEEFDGVAVGVFDLDLFAAGAGYEIVAEVDALVF